MGQFNRRQFLQASALGLTSLLSPAVASYGLHNWPKHFKRFLPGQFLHGVASGDPLADSVINELENV